MGSFFRRARRTEVVRYYSPDESDWVDMRAELTKREVNKLILATPKGAEDIEGSLTFIQRFAELAVVEWSMEEEDEDGELVKVPFSLDIYFELPGEQAQWLDRTFSEHLQKTMGGEVAEAEGKPSS